MTIRRAERWIWYLFLVAIPWQTRSVLWHSGLAFTEWLSVAVWASDVLMLALFALAAWRGWRPTLERPAIALIAVASLSLVHVLVVPVGFYQLVRLVQYILFFLYIRDWASPVGLWPRGRRFSPDSSALAFVTGALVQSAVAIAQYVLQHDIGLRWIGETLLRIDMRGVAVFYDTAGEKILRAYGTMPHPNVLALYLVIAWWAILWLWSRHQSWAYGAMMVFVVAALELTFARTVIFFWLAGVAGYIVWMRKELATVRAALTVTSITLLLVTTVCWPQVWARMTIHSSDEAVRLRVAYARGALGSGNGLLSLNWIGVGLGNFTPWLVTQHPDPRIPIQPAHSAYLMAYAEIGIVGLAVWLWWLATVLRSGWKSPMTPLILTLLLVAANDHFTWTLQQGRILWWGLLALYARPN